ncbi:MAG: copper-containing nitrite reductase [Betaproteobacteria bacterium]|nr:copper-containing nitrite reductase [Betaproteobacteria bacterium]
MSVEEGLRQGRRGFLKQAGLTAGTISFIGRAQNVWPDSNGAARTDVRPADPIARVTADPTNIPPPITRRRPAVVPVLLEAKEVLGEIENGVFFKFMTYNGQVPGPFIRVREGDTVELTVRNPTQNTQTHNVDMHAVMGPGGGALATLTHPGEEAHLRFKATYPGAFIYHCAVSNMDMHISSGMFGMILVEPKKGLPHVDHEFYLGQHEIYTDKPAGTLGYHGFNVDAMVEEQPNYVLFNGAKDALTATGFGPMKVKTGETARVFLVVGGPNLSSSFHAIGNVWHELWPEGQTRNPAHRYIQTYPVPPGSTVLATLRFPVPGVVKLVDHALTRVVHKGCLAVIEAEGPEVPSTFAPGGVHKL